jgi:hypothetical protein
MKALAISLAAGAALCASPCMPASAMPAAKLTAAASELALDQSVRWVCGRRGRCRLRPDYDRPRVYSGYRPGWVGYGQGRYGIYGPAWYGGYGPGLYGRWW